ncbi:MAG TPA: 50S ribosomal protein L11 methyltransferase [Acidobacteriota bacterium]|nr:50S ribosomal protein L11 methyltransferase [Acidobacteriota bacterium]
MAALKPQGYIEVQVDVPSQVADAVCSFITDNLCPGLVLEEEEGSPSVGIIFYVPQAQKRTFRKPLTAYLSQLVGEAMPSVPPIREHTIEAADWEEEYRMSVKPVLVAPDVLVRPVWREPETAVAYDIVIEPKMAFGTGAHETTQSCLRAVREHFQPGMRFLDMGCGSGILSILADKMGASYIRAVDYDLTAVENCRENLAVNRVVTRHDVLFGSIDKCDRDEPYQFVCANIIKSTILSMLDRLLSLTAPGGFLVLSGLLEPDRDEVVEALRRRGQNGYSTEVADKWITYTIRKV